MASIDLTGIPVIDNHCHGLYLDRGPFNCVTWRRFFTEPHDPEMARSRSQDGLLSTTAAPTGGFPRMRALRGGGAGHAPGMEPRGTDPLPAPDSEYRHVADRRRLPSTRARTGGAELTRVSGCRVLPTLPLETLMEQLITKHDTLDGAIAGLIAELQELRGQGYVALKSIAAYCTGLDIQDWPNADIERSFAAARQEALEQGSLRLAHKPLLDALLRVAFIEAAKQEIPVQFHVGYGDADLLRDNPLLLRPVLECPAYRGLPVVLLHACYPYTREGGYLASVYQQVYLDLSYGIPFLGYSEMLAFTRAARGIAPISKLLYCSDGVGIPELHWLGTLNGRLVLGAALSELVEQGELSAPETEATGAAVLSSTARALYRL